MPFDGGAEDVPRHQQGVDLRIRPFPFDVHIVESDRAPPFAVHKHREVEERFHAPPKQGIHLCHAEMFDIADVGLPDSHALVPILKIALFDGNVLGGGVVKIAGRGRRGPFELHRGDHVAV